LHKNSHMIKVGEYNELEILRQKDIGLFLGDCIEEEILLPTKYCPEKFELKEKITVFVYRDSEDRKIATNLEPKIHLKEFAFLKVVSVDKIGAFLDWGLEKDLMVPFKEQRKKMEANRWYIVYMDIDTETDRLYASNKIDKHIQNEELTVKEGDEVKILVYKKTELGYSVIINNQHKGLIFNNEIFKDLNIGDRTTAYVKKIREENKIDISLQAIGFLNYQDKNVNLLIDKLQLNNGFLALTDKSLPEEIYQKLAISKKAFKRAVGALLKAKKIIQDSKGIRLTE